MIEQSVEKEAYAHYLSMRKSYVARIIDTLKGIEVSQEEAEEITKFVKARVRPPRDKSNARFYMGTYPDQLSNPLIRKPVTDQLIE